MKLKAKIGYKLHCFVNYLWYKTEWKVLEYLNDYFANWWINEYLEREVIKMKKIGNLFELAEKQLIREKKLGLIPCYTMSDIIDYAILIRKYLDHNPRKIKKILKLTQEEKKRNNREARKRYYLKYKK